MHIQWVVAIATRKMSRRAHFFVNWIFSVRCPNIGSLDTLNDIQVGHQKGKNAVEMKTEIEFELTLNVRCSGQNSVFNWFIFLEYSILWQFHGVDLWPFCIWIRYIVATWMELVGETKIAAWAVDVHLYLYIDSFANREKRTKTGCHIHNKYCVPSVCCKGGGNILTRKICKFTSGIGFERSTFIWTDTHSHTSPCWNMNFQYFREILCRLPCECDCVCAIFGAYQSEGRMGSATCQFLHGM